MRGVVRLSLLMIGVATVGACTSGSGGADSSQSSGAVAAYAASGESHPGYVVAYQRCRQTDTIAQLAQDLHPIDATPDALAVAFSKTFPPELQADAAAGCLDGLTGQQARYCSDATNNSSSPISCTPSSTSSGSPSTLVADPDGVLARQQNPYVVIDGVATTLGGGSGTIGQYTGVLRVVAGHSVTVLSGAIRYPPPVSSSPTVLVKQGDDYDGVFLGVSPGRAQLLIETPACVRPAEPTSLCVLADVEVTT